MCHAWKALTSPVHVTGILHGLAQDDQQRDVIFRSKCRQVCHSYISSSCIAQKQRKHTYCISNLNSGPGLDSPQQGGFSPVQVKTLYSVDMLNVFSLFCGSYTCSAPDQSWIRRGQFHDSHRAWQSLIGPMHKPYIHIA